MPDDIEPKLPDPFVKVIVVSGSFRCLGYLDLSGVWRDATREEVIPDVIGWIAMNSDRLNRVKTT
jgi:hypothetical protein